MKVDKAQKIWAAPSSTGWRPNGVRRSRVGGPAL
jgi:hypothetical protein